MPADTSIPLPMMQLIASKVLSVRKYSVMCADFVMKSRARLDLWAENSGSNMLARETKL